MYEKLPQSNGNIVGYAVSGTITKDEFQEIASEVEQIADRHGVVRLLLRMPELPDQELVSTLGDRLQFLRDNVKRIDRYAVVTDDTRAEWLSWLGDKLMPMDLRTFETTHELEAWEWLTEDRPQ